MSEMAVAKRPAPSPSTIRTPASCAGAAAAVAAASPAPARPSPISVRRSISILRKPPPVAVLAVDGRMLSPACAAQAPRLTPVGRSGAEGRRQLAAVALDGELPDRSGRDHRAGEVGDGLDVA